MEILTNRLRGLLLLLLVISSALMGLCQQAPAGFSAGSAAINFYINDNPSVYAYSGETREVFATVQISIVLNGTYIPGVHDHPSWTVSISGPDPNNPQQTTTVGSATFTHPGPYTKSDVSITLPAAAGAYTYTASLTGGEGTPAPVPDSARIVEVASLEYKIGTGDFAAVPGTLYLPKGTAVTFKAIPNPSSVWPSGKPVWGGTSGATGTSETKAVTFNTAGTFTTTAQCGNTVTANVVVVEVQKIQYDNDSTFIDMPAILYIPLSSSTITFKAIATPDGIWPEGYPIWGGTSGATGTGETMEVSFSGTGEYTVTSECGNTVTSTIVVYTIDISTSDGVPLAVGGIANAAHQKIIKATLRPLLPNPADVTFSIIGDTGVNIAASLSSTDPIPFNEQGEAEVTLTSSDLVEDITVEGVFMDEAEQMILSQEAWQYFNFSYTLFENTTPMKTEVALSIYKLADGQIPLQGHNIQFSIAEVYVKIEEVWVKKEQLEWSNYAIFQTPVYDITDGDGTVTGVIEWGDGDIAILIKAEDDNVWISNNE